MTWNHIYPLNDLREHDTESKDCWCHPEVDEDDQLVIHKAMDGREGYESGDKKS